MKIDKGLIKHWANLFESEELQRSGKDSIIYEHFKSKNPFAISKNDVLSQEYATLSSKHPTSHQIARNAAKACIRAAYFETSDQLGKKQLTELGVQVDVKLNGVAFPFKGKFDGLDSMEFADYYLNIDDAITDDDDLRKLNFEALIDELAPQLKNKVIIKKGELYIKSGKYSASIDIKEGTLTIQVTFKNETMCGYFHEGPEKPYPDETPEQFKKRRGELPTPNLPNESEDVAESSEPVSKKRRGIGNVIIEFSVPTEQGMKSIQKIMGPDELETWMNEVGVEDKIQNVFLKLASDDETSLELKPIVVKIRHN